VAGAILMADFICHEYNFNQHKQIGVKEIQVCGKTIVEAVV
jgi:hypothetical protein